MAAAQDRSIPTMRIDNPDELIFSMGVTSQEQGDLAGAERSFRQAAGRR